ncbi:antiviral reverse transcriptase Drt3b [Shewanella algae]|uniref:antiviral reverse transcriptase Drt3b n=1 Tax=Shewanella algae TaxID=38313 RepID=UPI00313BFF17
MSKINSISTGDINRILLSETAPFDIPLIFSNIWFYNHVCAMKKGDIDKNAVVKRLFASKPLHKHSVPMKYRIRKNDQEFRHIGVIHPAEQFKFIAFYKEFSATIIHYTNISPISIRYPKKLSSIYYIKNKHENEKKYRVDEKSNVSNESKFKHSTSFFSYGGHTRLHDFFDSPEYRTLETKYNFLWSIDISKCFDSIYTHSISWAIKGKNNAKSIVGHNDNFPTIFDKLMQSTNYNETNGIVIGNEVSRIFCEIILQKIDSDIISSLKKSEVIYGRDYEIRRYIDDYFIFAKQEAIAEEVIEKIQYLLHGYKLHINKNKTTKQGRPFITSISNSKITLSQIINELSNILFYSSKGNTEINRKTRIRDKEKLVTNFVNKVKIACEGNSKSYESTAGYIIGFLLRVITDLSESNKVINEDDIYKAREILIVVLDIGFHFFGISPNTANSTKLSIMCFIIVAYSDKALKDESKSLKLKISSLIKNFFESGSYISLVESQNYFPIELSNLLTVARNMGNSYLLSPKEVKNIFSIDVLDKEFKEYRNKEVCSDYFRIMCALYYIGDHEIYNEIKETLVKCIDKRVNEFTDIDTQSKHMFLLLDSIACPYIMSKDREKWAKKLKQQIKVQAISDGDFYQIISNDCWFISWNYPDLWNTLEKKQLMLSY